MRATCFQRDLRSGLGMVMSVVPTRTPLPVLSHVLIDAPPAGLSLSASNLERGVSCRISARVDAEGAITVPAKLFHDVVANLPADQVVLTLDLPTQTLHITCGRYTTNIRGIAASEFPHVPLVETVRPVVTIPAALLQRALLQVGFAAATDESRPVLTGVLMQIRDQLLTLVASDGYRLAVRAVALDTSDAATEILVPAQSLLDWSKNLKGVNGTVDLAILDGGRQLLLRTDPFFAWTRLLDGSYPDFRRVIPTEDTTLTTVDRESLTNAIRLAALFAPSPQPVVTIAVSTGNDVDRGQVWVRSQSIDVGDNQGYVDAIVEGPPNSLAVNVEFLQDALNACNDHASITLAIQSANQACVVKPVGADLLTQIIMPITLRS